MKRTGSTWQANAVRLLCEQAYGEKNVWIGEEYQGMAKNEVTINKVHPYIRGLANRADFVFTSYRDLVEVRKSWKRFKGEFPSHELFKRWIAWLIHWNLHADHMTKFERLEDRRSRLAEFFVLGNKLGVATQLSNNQKREAFQALENLEPPSEEEEYDERTLMFSNHLTSKRFQS